MSPVEVSISGYSEIHRYPDRGILSIDIRSTGLSKEDVSENVRLATEIATNHFKALYGSADSGAAITLYTIDPLVTKAVTKHKLKQDGSIAYNLDGMPEKQWLEFETSATGEAAFCDFVKLSETANFLSTTKHVNIQQTKWILLAETKKSLLSESVREAYAEAMVRAQAYADGMRLHTIRAVKITDMGGSVSSTAASHSHGRQKHTAFLEKHRREEAGQAGAESFGFAPKLVTMSGECEVEFEIF